MLVSANIETECFLRLLFDQETKSQFVCDAACPERLKSVWNDATSNPWLLSRWNKEEIWRKTHINALELLAIVAAVWTVGKSFSKTARLFSFVITPLLCQRQCTVTPGLWTSPPSPTPFYLLLAALKCTPFFDWVPSLANCADIPSRPQGVTEEAFYARVKVTRWPEKNKRIVFSVIFRCFSHQNKISSV